jgi:hypothetical protein
MPTPASARAFSTAMGNPQRGRKGEKVELRLAGFLPEQIGQDKGSPGRTESTPSIKAPFAPRAFNVAEVVHVSKPSHVSRTATVVFQAAARG